MLNMPPIHEKYLDFIKKCNIFFPEVLISKLDEFRLYLESENNKYNLTRIIDEDDFWCKHICDSLSILKYFSELLEKELNIIDIGCGAGFPSIVLALSCPKLNIIAIDSVGKKIEFIKRISDKLNIHNIKAINIRSKEMKPTIKFDIITARAVAEPIKIFRESRKLLSDNGKYVLYKTPQEILGNIDHINKLTENQKFSWRNTEIFKLPDGSERLFLVGEKVRVSH